MSLPEPDSATLDAWLSGQLAPEQADAVDQYFEQHPEALISKAEPPGDLLIELGDQDQVQEDVALEALVDRIKTNPGVPLRAASDTAWQEILDPAEDPGLLGLLGPYAVEEVISAGGMGIVLKAHDPKLERTIAIKVLSPQLATNATARERFLREARAAAKLEHENILPIHAVHDEAAVPYFTMRYADCGTLEDLIRGSGKVGIERLKSITKQVAAALAAAHEKGIVHRDIKPGNILFDDDGEQLWVCDFGIARSTDDPSLTYGGAVAGTPQYMSPEQAQGGEIDGRSDLFSLGAVLYRCATGKVAFEGDTSASVLQNVSTTIPERANQINAKLPKWFARLLENLLAKDPRDRFSNAGHVVRAVEDEHAPRPKHRARRNRRIAITAVSLIALSALLFGLLQIPAIKKTANRALASRHEQGFTISGKLGAFGSLEEAVANSRDGDTIELPSGSPIAVDNLQLPTGKSLTFVSANPGKRPLLTTTIAGAPGIVANAPLRLTGLDFELNPKRDSDGIVIVRSTDMEIEDCNFRARREVVHRWDDVKARTIDLYDGASAEITACDFDLEETNAITFFDRRDEGAQPTSVRLSDCRVKAFYAINLYKIDAVEPGVTVELSQVQFSGQTVFKHSPFGVLPTTQCTVENSQLSASQWLCWFQRGKEETVRKRFRWFGKNNTFPVGNTQVRVGAGRELDDIKSLTPILEFGGPLGFLNNLAKREIAPTIQIEATGERFNDLGEAIDQLPDGGTLLLSGQIVPDKEILTPRGRTIHLRAAPGATATIVARRGDDHALFIRGPTTVRGIRFEQPNEDATIPVLGIGSTEGEIVVEDCHFRSHPNSSRSRMSYGLILTNIKTATLRRCTFHNPGGISLAVFFNDKGKPDLPLALRLEDCVFTGRCGLSIRSRIRGARASVSAERCVAVNEHFYLQDGRDDFAPVVTLAFGDCIFDTNKALLSIPDGTPRQLAEIFTWHGKGNYYRSGRDLLFTPKERAAADFVATTASSFAELQEAVPSSSEDSGKYIAAPFNRRRLAKPIIPSALHGALDPDIVSPAVETLETLGQVPQN